MEREVRADTLTAVMFRDAWACTGALKDLLIAVERTKAQIRARVEHPFHVIKNLFGHRKVRYKGLVKNTAQLFSLFGLANLALARKRLLASRGSNPS